MKIPETAKLRIREPSEIENTYTDLLIFNYFPNSSMSVFGFFTNAARPC